MAESSQDDAKLDLKVRDGNGAVTHFKVKKSTKFRKILTAYAGKAGINPDTIRMMVDGQRVNLEQCPGDYDMESGDQIDAMAEQQGGLGQDPAAAAVAAALRDNLAPGPDRGGARAPPVRHGRDAARARGAQTAAHRARRRRAVADDRAAAGISINKRSSGEE